ncbi:MAG: hypothetical protein HDS65_00815 [Bacteroidales bacterium]|nr:hypothetical protein [Bacteroidales bacterium]
MAVRKTPKPDTKPRRSTLQRILRGLAISVDVLLGAALCLTAYAGNISPLQHGGIWGIFPLCFPFCLVAAVIILILQLFWNRIGALIMALAMLICAGPIWDYCPLHFGTPSVPDDATKFTLLSYNVHNFLRPGEKEYDTSDDSAVAYILNTDADIVCLQEASFLALANCLPAKLVYDIHNHYPNVLINDEVALLSRFPVQAVHLDPAPDIFKGADVACWRVTLPSGRFITVFNVHLESMRMKDDDREMYRNLTEFHRESIHDVKERILSKLSFSAVNRARQVQQLLRYIRLYGGPDVIITGDFNDVPGCYAIHALADAGFRSAYADRALGPAITFNQSRLYFRIDHTLYRGELKPLAISRGSTGASDHYPLVSSWALW